MIYDYKRLNNKLWNCPHAGSNWLILEYSCNIFDPSRSSYWLILEKLYRAKPKTVTTTIIMIERTFDQPLWLHRRLVVMINSHRNLPNLPATNSLSGKIKLRRTKPKKAKQTIGILPPSILPQLPPPWLLLKSFSILCHHHILILI